LKIIANKIVELRSKPFDSFTNMKQRLHTEGEFSMNELAKLETSTVLKYNSFFQKYAKNKKKRKKRNLNPNTPKAIKQHKQMLMNGQLHT